MTTAVNERKPKNVLLIWYRGSESNRHGVTTTGF